MCKANNVHELQSQLNACLSKVAAWFKVNKLTLNIDKTKFMICGTKTTLEKFHDVKLTFNGSAIERVDEFKYLGVKLAVCPGQLILIICVKMYPRKLVLSNV